MRDDCLMSGMNSKHVYQATFMNGALTHGEVACPACGASTLHPTGHTMPLESQQEYAPVVSLVAWCECGQGVALELGNYKGDFGIDVIPYTPMP